MFRNLLTYSCTSSLTVATVLRLLASDVGLVPLFGVPDILLTVSCSPHVVNFLQILQMSQANSPPNSARGKRNSLPGVGSIVPMRVEWERLQILSSVPKKRRGHSIVCHKNKLYLFGGYFGSHSGDLWMFTPGLWTESDANFYFVTETLKWKKLDIVPLTETPLKRTGHSACIFKNKMVFKN